MKRKGFIKSMLLATIMLLGVGYAVVSSQTLTSDATITIGERAVNVEILSGTLHDITADIRNAGTVGNDGLTISFDVSINEFESYSDEFNTALYIEFINRETDINVEIRATDIDVKLDDVDYEDCSIVDEGIYTDNGEYTYILGSSLSGTFDVFVSFPYIDITRHSKISISVTFTASVSE